MGEDSSLEISTLMTFSKTLMMTFLVTLEAISPITLEAIRCTTNQPVDILILLILSLKNSSTPHLVIMMIVICLAGIWTCLEVQKRYGWKVGVVKSAKRSPKKWGTW